MRLFFSILAVTSAPFLSAQVPYQYLLTAETSSATTGTGMRFVDPASGVVTEVRGVPGGTRVALPRAATVTIDQTLPTSIPFVSGISSSIAPAFQRATVQGNQHTATTSHVMSGTTGIANRLEWTPTGMLAAIGTGTRPGLWQAPAFGGAAVQLAPLAGAFDVAAGGNFAYVSSYSAGAPTQIEEVNLTNATVRTVGSAYPALRALTLVTGVGLFAGTDTGALLIIDPVSGAIMNTRNLFANAIIALAGDASGGTLFALTDANEVYDVSAPGVPVYRSTQRVNDIAVGTVDLASFLIFGNGCGSAVVPSHQAATGVPSVGNGAFAVSLIGGVVSAPAVFVFGGSRTTYLGLPLPLALDFLQMTGCSLYTDVAVTIPLVLNASGNGIVPLAIPNAPRIAGTHFTTQWFSLDVAANQAGVVASDGGEGIIR